jgi:hypothetical protein
MSKSKQEQDLSTIPTRDLIWNILGDDQNGLSCAQITPDTAMVLHEKLRNSLNWCIEYHTVDGSRLTYPMLWRYADWKTASSTYKKQKAYSDRMREELWLLQANVSMLSKAIMKKSPIPESAAEAMAYQMIKNPNAIIVIQQFFGVAKLKTDIKEI